MLGRGEYALFGWTLGAQGSPVEWSFATLAYLAFWRRRPKLSLLRVGDNTASVVHFKMINLVKISAKILKRHVFLGKMWENYGKKSVKSLVVVVLWSKIDGHIKC